MANVFTRKHRHPRSVTLLDYQDVDVSKQARFRPISPTRTGNPHPPGLKNQNIPKQKCYLIWNPIFANKEKNYPAMIAHMKHVNFSCSHPDKFDNLGGRGKVPNIKFTENTESRESFIDPVRFPELIPEDKHMKSRFSYSPNKKPLTGIVPNLIVPEYLPVIER